MLERPISLGAEGHTCPCGVVGIEVDLMGGIEHLRRTIVETSSIGIVDKFIGEVGTLEHTLPGLFVCEVGWRRWTHSHTFPCGCDYGGVCDGIIVVRAQGHTGHCRFLGIQIGQGRTEMHTSPGWWILVEEGSCVAICLAFPGGVVGIVAMLADAYAFFGDRVTEQVVEGGTFIHTDIR